MLKVATKLFKKINLKKLKFGSKILLNKEKKVNRVQIQPIRIYNTKDKPNIILLGCGGDGRTRQYVIPDNIMKMEKIEIAKELLKNTINKYIIAFIQDYIEILELDDIKNCNNEEFIRFDKCISYIKKVGFNINGWMLFEIPIEYAHCFWNKTTKKAFDLDVFDINKQVIPTYLDDKSNEQSAKTIEEAIEKYNNTDYINSKR
jgi:hypothetical protein